MYQTTALHWDAAASLDQPPVKSWQALPPVARHIARKVTGDEAGEIWTYVTRKYFGDRWPVDRILSLGCGLGSLERWLATLGFFRSCDAMDLSGGSISVARESARKAGCTHINYQQRNLDTAVFQPGAYDAIFADSILHHLWNLETVLPRIASALKLDGLLIVNEYVGPSQFQFSDREIEAMNAAISLLPRDYRRLRVESGQIARLVEAGDRRALVVGLSQRIVSEMRRGTLPRTLKGKVRSAMARGDDEATYLGPVRRVSIAEQKAVDPSEAIRSSEIIPLLEDHFEILERKDYGGTILHFGLASIVHNFVVATEQSDCLLEMLIHIEDTLIEKGDLDSHFTFIVARPR